MLEQIAHMQIILEKLAQNSFENKGKEKTTVSRSSDKDAKLEQRVEGVEVLEAVIKIEEAPFKEQQNLRHSMVLLKEELIDHDEALILSNPIDSLPTNFFIKSKRVDFIDADDFDWFFSLRLVDLVNELKTNIICLVHLEEFKFQKQAKLLIYLKYLIR